ncbi:acetyltransferase (GNAT) family protein [Ancylobacter aquaticus]|uniref:Acetyltransferase (GNAT) family protein n=1 Tax=Ancylobacter aquaticus TaxID=100 RepID=A0A4R1I5E4_ANCAQ|nr:GNAT family N-acetyltransferase [Ancylobacter aquaticus]TCK30118.1 acetyltransferase (GNAT) family protein [Ancylobacter aquaticus]
MTSPCRMSDLREVPAFAAVVAERVWRAWWEAKGVPLAALRARLDESFGPGVVPSTFVAHEQDRFLGCVALIAADVDLRPALTPWVAALWVEPDARRQGIGAALVVRATEAAFAAGHECVYLAAEERRASYYAGRGWTLLEPDVEGLEIFVRRNG